MRRSILLLSLCLVAVALAGCGQKGPLVRSPDWPAPAPASSTVMPAPAASSSVPASAES